MFTIPYITPTDSYYTLAATFFAFLPLLLHYITPERSPKPSPQEESSSPQKAPLLAWFVSDIEAEILELLSDVDEEMNTFDIAKSLNYWPENVHTTLCSMHERGIIRMRDTILWSVPG